MSSRLSQALRDQQIGHDLDPYLEAAGYGGQLLADQNFNSSGSRGIQEPEPPFSIEDFLRASDSDDENAVDPEAVAEGEDETEHAEQIQVDDPFLLRTSSKRQPTKAGDFGSTQDPSRQDSRHPSYQPYKPNETSPAMPKPRKSNRTSHRNQSAPQYGAGLVNQAGIDQTQPQPRAEDVVASQIQPDAEDANGDDPDSAPSEDDESEEMSYWDSLGLPPLAAGAKHPQRVPAEIPNDDFEAIYKKKPKWIKKILRVINTAQKAKDPKTLSAKRKKLNRFCRKQIAELQAKPNLFDRVDTMVMNVIFIHREGFFPDTEINGRPASDLDVEGDMTCTERMEKLLAAIANEAVLALCIALGADMTLLLCRPTTYAIGDDFRVPELEAWDDDGESDEEGMESDEEGMESDEEGMESAGEGAGEDAEDEDGDDVEA